MIFSNDFKYIKQVANTLSKTDLLHICRGTFNKSPYTKYRLCLILNDKPVGFVEVYNLPGEEYEFIVIAISPEYRKKGYSYILLDKMFKEYNSKYPYLWRCDKDNYSSIHLAKNYNFIKINETETKYEFERKLFYK